MESCDPRVPPEMVPTGSRPVIMAEHQDAYLDLPSIRTPRGHVITRWHPTEDERRQILVGEDLYLTISTFNQPLQPVMLTVGPVDWTAL
jgi:hypothetical protein